MEREFSINFIEKEMKMNQPAAANNDGFPEMTVDQAKEYDHIILVDQSGSMGDPSTKMEGKNRWEEAAEFTTAYARFAEQVDDDGITLILFNSRATVHDSVTADKVKETFSKNRPGGSTNLADALKKAFEKKFAAGKNAIVLVLTDGVPDSQSEVVKAIIDASNKIERDEQLAVQFIQIGDDPGAAKFLQKLDDDLQKEDAKFDIVNTLTREQAESLTVEQLLYQAVND